MSTETHKNRTKKIISITSFANGNTIDKSNRILPLTLASHISSRFFHFILPFPFLQKLRFDGLTLFCPKGNEYNLLCNKTVLDNMNEFYLI
jgi:hypothetical protein